MTLSTVFTVVFFIYNHFSSQLSASGTGLFSPTFARPVSLPASAADLEFPSSVVTNTFAKQRRLQLARVSPAGAFDVRTVRYLLTENLCVEQSTKPRATGCLFVQTWEMRLYISTAALSHLIFWCSIHKYVLGHSQRAESVYSLRCVGGSVARKRNRSGENSRTGSGKP